MSTLNLGILAHVDAGKTSLTERLLYAAGVIDEIGSVDDGSTQTDTLALERQRGITIKSAVVSFAIGDVTVNLIDTPGHPDFIAEVERVLSVLDGAVLVISAVEGVQAQTRVLMRALRRLRIPTLIFVNKIDRGGAHGERVLARHRGAADPGDRRDGSGRRPGHAAAPRFTPYGAGRRAASPPGWPNCWPTTTTRCWPPTSATRHRSPTAGSRRGLAAQTGGRWCTRCSSARRSPAPGVDALTGGHHRAAARGRRRRGRPGLRHRVQGRARRGRREDRLRPDVLRHGTDPGPAAASAGSRQRGRSPRSASSTAARPSGASRSRAGQIGKLWGLGDVQIGDTIGAPPAAPPGRAPLRPADPGDRGASRAAAADKGALHVALAQLAEQDPLINLRQDDVRQEISVSLYGEVQKEVIQATLAGDFGIAVGFRETTTICIERPAGTGAAVEIIDTPPNPFLATVGLRIDPAPAGSGVGVPAGGRARLAAARVLQGGRGHRAPTRCGRGCAAGRSPTAWSP